MNINLESWHILDEAKGQEDDEESSLLWFYWLPGHLHLPLGSGELFLNLFLTVLPDKLCHNSQVNGVEIDMVLLMMILIEKHSVLSSGVCPRTCRKP